MTADQSPPAFAEMGEEIAKGWESLQEDMQRLIMDPPGTELGSRGGPEVERHSPRSLVDDGTLLPVSERPAGTTAEVQAEEPFRDIGEKMGGWFRAFAAEIAGVFDDRDDQRGRDKPIDRGASTAQDGVRVGNVEDGRRQAQTSTMTTPDRMHAGRGASSAGEAGQPRRGGFGDDDDPGSASSTGRTGPNAGFEPLFAESPAVDGVERRTVPHVEHRGGYYTDGDDPFGNYPFGNRSLDVVPVTRQPGASPSSFAVEAQRLWGNPGRFVSFDDCAEVFGSLPEADDAMAACDAAVRRFNFRYAASVDSTPEERLAAWRRECSDLCRSTLRALVSRGGRFGSCGTGRGTNPRHRESLVNAVEGYVAGGIQGKVFHGVLATYASDDAEAERALAAIESLPPGALGLHPSHLNAVDSFAVGTIRGLANASCPRHMASAVCDVVRHLAANCARLRSWREEEERSGASLGAGVANGDDVADGDEPAPAPSTDDLLSLLVVLVAKARLRHPVSLAMYMDSFHALIGSQHVGEIGYALANFYGAVQYARSEPMRDLLTEWGIHLAN